MPTLEELKVLQALPLDIKIQKTQQRIREWVDFYGMDGVYVSFSGGKDSTVLLHLVRELYPSVEAVFVNTGLEYPEIQQFAKSFDNVTVLRPKMRFDEVIRAYGYPVISKEVSESVYEGRKALAIGKDTVKLRKVLGTLGPQKDGKPTRYNYSKYKPLLYVDFIIGSKCCNVMKKSPFKAYEHKTNKHPLIATMADESVLRQTNWVRHGCNAFDSERPKSAPMSFWTEQDVLAYIKAYNIPIASVYGDIVEAGNDNLQMCIDGCGKLKCTGCQRTGCIYCTYGCQLEKGETRFELLKLTHPKQYDYCMRGGGYDTDGLWKPTADGLGLSHVFDTLNEIYSKNGKPFIKY